MFLNGIKYWGVISDVIADWREQSRKRPWAGSVPTTSSSSLLKYIRQNACKQAGVSNCGCWESYQIDGDFIESKFHSVILDDGQNLPLSQSVQKVTFFSKSDKRILRMEKRHSLGNPCKDCRTPGVSLSEFSEKLFGREPNNGDLRRSIRQLRKWSYEGGSMRMNDFGTLVASACSLKWVGLGQAMSIFSNMIEHLSVAKALLAFRKEIKSREVTSADEVTSHFVQEVDREISLLTAKLVERGNRKIERSHVLSEEEKQFLIATELPQKFG